MQGLDPSVRLTYAVVVKFGNTGGVHSCQTLVQIQSAACDTNGTTDNDS